jgi:NAD(P)H-dependent flavin oxidoreductase YrpB (nitropropane dioxygenase family)
MLRTRLTDMLGIEHPVIRAPMGSATSPAFAAAASNAGGLGRVGTLNRPGDAVLRDLGAAAAPSPLSLGVYVDNLAQKAGNARRSLQEGQIRLSGAMSSRAAGTPGTSLPVATRIGDERVSLSLARITSPCA